MLTEAAPCGAVEVAGRATLAARWAPAAPPLEQVLRDLARRLATRPSRRSAPARHGARIDLRRSMRRSVRHGLDLVELARLATHLHVLKALGPTRLDLGELEFVGSATPLGIFELLSVCQWAAVTDLDAIRGFGAGAGALAEGAIDQAGARSNRL